MAATVMVIDDDPVNARLLKAIFTGDGHAVLLAEDGEAGIARAAADRPDLVMLDLRLPGKGGLEVLEALHLADPQLPVILMTAHADVKTAVRATQLGAFDYLSKPFDHDELGVVVRRALQTRALEREVAQLRRQVGEGAGLARSMGPSPQVRQVIEQVRTVAATNFTVLILGETGAGKELVAQAIHKESPRADKPFVALDCGAIPEALLESELFGHERGAFTGAVARRRGRLETAHRGTLFLDELGDLTPALQVKLLRAIEQGEITPVGGARTERVDVRIIAATNRDLEAMMDRDQFRSDLYHRVGVVSIELPALRSFRQNIPILVRVFLDQANRKHGRAVSRVTEGAMALLVDYRYPGNLRELRNVIERAVILAPGDEIGVAELPRALTRGAPPEPAVRARGLEAMREEWLAPLERGYLEDLLRATKGHVRDAARRSGLSPATFYRLLRRRGLVSARHAQR